MSDDMRSAILSAITQLGTDLRGEIAASRAETSRLLEGIQTSIDAIRDDITVLGGANDHTRKAGENTRDELRAASDVMAAMQRVLLKHGTRLDALERHIPPPKEDF